MQIGRNTDQNLLQNGAFLRGKKRGVRSNRRRWWGGGETCGRGMTLGGGDGKIRFIFSWGLQRGDGEGFSNSALLYV